MCSAKSGLVEIRFMISIGHFINGCVASLFMGGERCAKKHKAGVSSSVAPGQYSLSCPSKSNSKRIELSVHISCYWGHRLTLCYL